MTDSRTWYDVHLLPYLLDFACGLAPITRQRQLVVPRAFGDVLEIGIGTGLNLAHYDVSRVAKLVGVDPAEQMHRLTRRRSRQAGIALELSTLSAQALALPAASFDCVVCTYTLCSVSDPAAALAEVRRVLRPGGLLLFAEHGLAPEPAVARWQARLEPVWRHLAGGCHLTRDVPRLLEHAGFSCSCQCGYVLRPKALGYNFWGQAVAL